MVKYIIKRLLNGLIVLLGVVTITFFITRVVPSDVAGKWAGERATEEQRKQAIAELGLDKPLVTQYVNYLKDLLSGDLGRSLRTKEPITKELASFPRNDGAGAGSFPVCNVCGYTNGHLFREEKRENAGSRHALFLNRCGFTAHILGCNGVSVSLLPPP